MHRTIEFTVFLKGPIQYLKNLEHARPQKVICLRNQFCGLNHGISQVKTVPKQNCLVEPTLTCAFVYTQKKGVHVHLQH